MSQTTRNQILVVLGLAAAVAVEVLAKGRWAHAVWAPTAIMLLTERAKLWTGVAPPAPDAPAPTPAPAPEAKTDPPKAA